MEKKTKKERLQEERRRYEYMIAWRERYIHRLQELMEGKEEERALLNALLAVALEALAGNGEGVRAEAGEAGKTLAISKEAVRASLGKFTCQCAEEAEAYALTFLPVKTADGTP
jgi:hypothetical protein